MKMSSGIILIGLLSFTGLSWLAFTMYTSAYNIGESGTKLVILCYIILLPMVAYTLFTQTRRKKSPNLTNLSDEVKDRMLPDDPCTVMFTSNLSGHFTFISNQVKSLTGYDPEELIIKPVSFLATPAFSNLVSDHFKRQYLAKKPESTIYYPIFTKAGKQKWIEQLSVLTYEAGKVIGFQCILKDINSEKHEPEIPTKITSGKRRRYIVSQSSEAEHQWGISKGSWRLPFSEQSLN